jgi:hypothetical protein
VTWEGRPLVPHPQWAEPLHVTLAEQLGDGTVGVTQLFTPTTNDYGHFRLDAVVPGSYQLAVKGAHTLQRVVALTTTTGATMVDVGTLLEGDVVADNQINILDFSGLATAYGRCAEASTFNANADLNGDGCVNQADLDLLVANFGRRGDAPTTLSAAAVDAAPPVLTIRERVAGEQFVVLLLIGSQVTTPIDASALYLNFDAELLTVESVVAGGDFTTELQNYVDNEAGRINFAAGTLQGQILPPAPLVTLIFRAKTTFAQTQVRIETSGERRTELAAHGSAISPTLSGGVTAAFTWQEAVFNSLLYLPVMRR